MTDRVRDAMVSAPRVLDTGATAMEGGDALARDEVRAVIVVAADGRLAGIVTRKTLVREVVARGFDPKNVRLGEIAEKPLFTLDADMPLDEAFHVMEERDLERVPVLEAGRLVGVLSRSVVQRRLAEDEVPDEAGQQQV